MIAALPVAMADVIIESDLSLYELQDPPIGEAEKAVAGYAAEMVHDGDCIQLASVVSPTPLALN